MRRQTRSLWTDVLAQRSAWTSPGYDPGRAPRRLQPVAAVHRMRFWTDYFMRHVPSFSVPAAPPAGAAAGEFEPGSA